MKVSILQFEVHGHQMESLVEALLNQMRGPEEPGTSKKCRTSSVTNAAAEDVFNRLHVKYHADQGRGDGYVHWTLMESVERFWSFQGEELEQLVKGESADTSELIRVPGRVPGHSIWVKIRL